jgi:hypothetical protein
MLGAMAQVGVVETAHTHVTGADLLATDDDELNDHSIMVL